MKCPRCNAKIILEHYTRAYDTGKWMHEIHCSECHHHEILDVPEDETLEDFTERELQRLKYSMKHDIINCFKHGKEYTDNTLLESDELGLVKIEVKIHKTSWKEVCRRDEE